MFSPCEDHADKPTRPPSNPPLGLAQPRTFFHQHGNCPRRHTPGTDVKTTETKADHLRNPQGGAPMESTFFSFKHKESSTKIQSWEK